MHLLRIVFTLQTFTACSAWSTLPSLAVRPKSFSSVHRQLLPKLKAETTSSSENEGVSTNKEQISLLEKIRGSRAPELSFLLLLWYAFNAGFNVSNKRLLNQFNHPWILSWVQLATGILFVVPAWLSGARTAPIVDRGLLLKFLPIALLHAGGHCSQVASMGMGTVFFTHVIKAAEPVIGTLVVLLFTGKLAPWYVNLMLTPIVGGVAYASIKPGTAFDISSLVSTSALLALVSTFAFAIAKLLAKNLMTPTMKKDRNLNPANNYAVLTCCSASVLLLPSFIAEGPKALADLAALGPARAGFILEAIGCGMLYYMYNEMGFRVLNLLTPVSAAVCNSAKRVVVLFAAVVFLGEAVSKKKLIGSTVAIGGVTLYSVAKAVAGRRAKIEKEKKKEEVVIFKVTEGTDQPGTWQP